MEPNNYRQPDIILLGFIIAQVILLIIIGVSIAQVVSRFNDTPADDISYYESQPIIPIKNLQAKTKLSDTAVSEIEHALFDIARSNTASINIADTTAKIHKDTLIQQSLSSDVNYLSMIVDLPNLKQSYRIFYDPSGVLDPDSSVIIVCPDQSEQAAYPKFNCYDGTSAHSRNNITSTYLEQLNFDHFTIRIEQDNREIVIIPNKENPTENEKSSYIHRVKEAIKSLGLNPAIFEYRVTTYDDLDYEIE